MTQVRRGRKPRELPFNDTNIARLRTMEANRDTNPGLACRAAVLLALHAGSTHAATALQVGVSVRTVASYARDFADRGFPCGSADEDPVPEEVDADIGDVPRDVGAFTGVAPTGTSKQGEHPAGPDHAFNHYTLFDKLRVPIAVFVPGGTGSAGRPRLLELCLLRGTLTRRVAPMSAPLVVPQGWMPTLVVRPCAHRALDRVRFTEAAQSKYTAISMDQIWLFGDQRVAARPEHLVPLPCDFEALARGTLGDSERLVRRALALRERETWTDVGDVAGSKIRFKRRVALREDPSMFLGAATHVGVGDVRLRHGTAARAFRLRRRALSRASSRQASISPEGTDIWLQLGALYGNGPQRKTVQRRIANLGLMNVNMRMLALRARSEGMGDKSYLSALKDEHHLAVGDVDALVTAARLLRETLDREPFWDAISAFAASEGDELKFSPFLLFDDTPVAEGYRYFVHLILRADGKNALEMAKMEPQGICLHYLVDESFGSVEYVEYVAAGLVWASCAAHALEKVEKNARGRGALGRVVSELCEHTALNTTIG